MSKITNSKPFILLLLTGAVFLFLKYISPLVAPVLVAILFLTIFGSTLKKMQEKFHIHRQIGAILLLLLAIMVVVLVAWILYSWIVGSLPVWIGRLDVWEQDIAAIVRAGCRTVGQALRMDSEYLENTILGIVQDGIDYFQERLASGVLSYSLTSIKALGRLGAFLVTFIITTVLLAKDYDAIVNGMLDREEWHIFLEVVCGIIRYVATFVKAQGIIMGAIACLAAVILGISGVRQGILWGIVAGIMDVLPFVGTGIILFPLAILQLFQGYYGKAAACILLYIGCIFLREILEPKLIGRRIGVNPVAVLVSLYAGIQLFGVGGIIKGPLGFMIIYQTYLSLQRRAGREKPG